MTYKEIATMVKSIGLPYAYYQFPDGTEQEPPFVCFLYSESDDVYADNKNYVPIRRLIVELYMDKDGKDLSQEVAVESVLTNNNLSFRKTEEFIKSEAMWQITYESEVIINE